MWCFAVSVGAVHNDYTVSVVNFDIAGTLKQKVGVALPASAAQPQKRRFDEKRKFGSFGCRQCRLVIRPRRGNFHSDLI